MIGFLNERSLEEHVNLQSALLLFLEAARQLAAVDAKLMKNSAFFFAGSFKGRFGSLRLSGELKGPIRELVFSERYYKCWRPARISRDIDVYLCDNPQLELIDESLCEAAEGKLQYPASDTATLSAPDSEFQNLEALQITNTLSGEQTVLRNIVSLELVTRWVVQQRGYYSPDSVSPPLDFQTVLEKQLQRFRPTRIRSRKGSRKIFEEPETGRLYHVCSGHFGASAHLEVFYSNHEHFGKADINTGESISPRITGRKLRM